jgi:hypothetical protein
VPVCSGTPHLANGQEVSYPAGSKPLFAGPLRTFPYGSKRDPWHGQSEVFSAWFQFTTQPRCGQIAENLARLHGHPGRRRLFLFHDGSPRPFPSQSSVHHQYLLRYPSVDTTVQYVSGGHARGEKLPFLTYGPTIVGVAFTESFGLNVNVSSFRLNQRPSLLNLIRRSISRKKATIPQDSGL